MGVEGESAELGAVGAEDADLAAGDEEDDAPAFERGSDADGVEAAAVAQGEVSLLAARPPRADAVKMAPLSVRNVSG